MNTQIRDCNGKLDKCESKLEAYLDLDECSNPHACAKGYACFNTIGSFECVDVNECTNDYHQCDNNARCENSNGGYSCVCNEGFTGKIFSLFINEQFKYMYRLLSQEMNFAPIVDS